jgi:hypothetical protein
MLAATALLTFLATPAAAQDPDPNPGAFTITGGYDFTNAYMFRGIKQESDGLIMYPYVDVGVALYTGEGSLKSFGVNFGTWNSLHAGGDTGTNNPRNRKLWYESDIYMTLSFGLSGGVTAGLTYTTYTSPNASFESIKEMSFKVSVDDSKQLGKFSLKPYGLLATEMDTGTGSPGCSQVTNGQHVTGGQADCGANWGAYLELGIAPTYSSHSFYSVAFPVKGGFSLSNYYESPFLGRQDASFGFASAGAQATVPFTKPGSKYGQWNVHGGVDFMFLGGTTREWLGETSTDEDGNIELDDHGNIDYKSNKIVYTFGIGFTY